jgi:hypothetical protein
LKILKQHIKEWHMKWLLNFHRFNLDEISMHI